MAKRHLAQTSKQGAGQYYTTVADRILERYTPIVQRKSVTDPFAGRGDLLTWALANGATKTQGYDLHPQSPYIAQRDTLLDPPSYANQIVVTNPPYLHRNKCRQGSYEPYDKWEQDDLYKCFLATLAPFDCDQAIVVVPTNFLCEARSSARETVFSNYFVEAATYWEEPIFEDATTGVCTLHLIRGQRVCQTFPMILCPSGEVLTMDLHPENDYLHGNAFFDYLRGHVPAHPLQITKVDVGMPPPNTKLVAGLADDGKWPWGLSYNEGADYYCEPKAFFTYQLHLTNAPALSSDDQRKIAALFQERLWEFRHRYHGMFIANYMGARQRLLSRGYVARLLQAVMVELNLVAREATPILDLFG